MEDMSLVMIVLTTFAKSSNIIGVNTVESPSNRDKRREW
jgi:hypothetical protein